MKASIERDISPLESLKQSCIEMKLMRDGKLPSNGSWRDMFRRIEEEAKTEEKEKH